MVLSLTPPVLTTWLGPTDGSAVDRGQSAQLANFLVPEAITRSLGFGGGDRLDHVLLMYNIAATGERVVNIATPTGYSRQIEVHWEHGGGSYTPIFWGDLTRQTARAGRSESFNMSAAVYPYHFGVRLDGMVVFDVLSGGGSAINEPIEFNAIVDGIIQPNMSSRLRADGTHYWGDPESFRTAQARTYQGATLSEWSLSEAVDAMCWNCNPSETFIKNPTSYPASMASLPALKNVTLPDNQYLPVYLDQLLHPYGYDWGLSLTASGGTTTRTITVVERGVGTLKQLTQQPPGQNLDLAVTDTEDWRVTTDIAGAVNECRVLGGHKQYEGTFELYRGWPEADDDLTASDLAIDDEMSDYHSGKANVWRSWVANEAGDYNSTRTMVAPIPAQPNDWSGLGVRVDRRRRFEECLAYEDDGFTRRQPFLEWSDDGGSTWRPSPPEWSYHIRDNECAVYFAGNTPPAELMAAGDDAALRITAVVSGDARLDHLATDTDNNCPNGRTHRLTVDMSDAFAFREQLDSGDFASTLESDPANTIDDSTPIETEAEEVLEREVSGLVDGDCQLVGVRFDYELSDVLSKIAGREIDLNRNSAGGTTDKYPQITGITWMPQSQRTRLETRATEVEWYYQRNTPGRSRYGRAV